jgi:hypothetical protein
LQGAFCNTTFSSGTLLQLSELHLYLGKNPLGEGEFSVILDTLKILNKDI